MKKQKRGIQKSRHSYIPAPGDGVQFPYAKPNSAEEKRIRLIVRVDRAVTHRDRATLIKLQRECKGIPLLKSRITKALEG
jgi:hypothetical protein